MGLIGMVGAAGASGSGDLIVGLILGACIGFLLGPVFRSWTAHREWREASREADLADLVLARMELDEIPEAIPDPHRSDDEEIPRAWRTLP